MTILDGIPFLPAVHFTKGREAKIDTIVLHWMATTLAGCDATFTSGNRRASAHYGIEGTTVHRYVKDTDTAWHAGDRPTNHRSIGIEHSAQPGRDATTTTIATSVALCVALCRKYGISPDRIFPHKKFVATMCPGTLPVAEIVARVRALLTVTPPTPTPEVDMPLTDADLANIAAEVWNRFKIHGPAGDVSLQATLGQLLYATDPTALAAALAKSLPATGTVTQTQLEAALRTVLGSVDGKV